MPCGTVVWPHPLTVHQTMFSNVEDTDWTSLVGTTANLTSNGRRLVTASNGANVTWIPETRKHHPNEEIR